MRKMLENGVHFGHQTRKWNPKMKQFIYTAKNGVYIIDLAKTQAKLEVAYDALKKIAEDGGKILFVGTKKQAQAAIKDEALRSGMYFVNERWLGGMLTNYKTISKRIARLAEIREMEADGTIDKYAKKEALKIRQEADKLEKFLGGIKDMKGMPGAMFVVDPKKEKIAVKEARTLGIPVVGIVDTNCDPDDVDYVIPANDDAKDSVAAILGACCEAIAEGLTERKAEKADEKANAEQSEVAPEAKPKRSARKTEEAPKAENEAPVAE